MKEDSVIKLLIALSVSNASSSDFRNFISWIRYSDDESAHRLYSTVRNRLRHVEYDILDVDIFERRPGKTFRSAENDIISMQKASGLGVKESVEMLEHQLIREGFSGQSLVKFSSKDGFRSWIARCIKAFGENKMLSAAAQAFSQHEGSESHWKLG